MPDPVLPQLLNMSVNSCTGSSQFNEHNHHNVQIAVKQLKRYSHALSQEVAAHVVTIQM